MRRSILLCMLFGILVAMSSNAAEQGQPATPAGDVVLDTYSYWRGYVMFRPVVYARTAAEASIPEGQPRSDPPPSEWTQPDFDDIRWSRVRGPIYGGYGFCRRGGGPRERALMCLRGKFRVADPGRVQSLTFSAVFRGGAVLYLNGKEAKRVHLPDGEILPETISEEYPIDAYVEPDGKKVLYYAGSTLKDHKDRLDIRLRRFDDISIPVADLRKGVNVIALEIHRAPYDPDVRELRDASKTSWTSVGLEDVALRAAPAGSVESNTSRPKGIQLWNTDPIDGVCDLEYSDPCETLGSVRIVGARNGRFSGQIVVSSDQNIAGLRVTPGALSIEGGDGEIPADAVAIRYALPTGQRRNILRRFDGMRSNLIKRFDALTDTTLEAVEVRAKEVSIEHTGAPPPVGAVQPVRITVHVPKDASPGNYTGTVTVAAQGLAPVKVPVALTVCAWTLPEIGAYETHIGCIQSVESSALYYKVPLWSDKHWELTAKSLQVLGSVGNDCLFIPIIARHHFGKESLVRWIKKEGGGYDYDFALFEKYVDLAMEHMGRPQVVCLYVWAHNYGESKRNRKKKEEDKTRLSFPVLDPKTGEITEENGPLYYKPEAIEFWKPVLDGCLARLKKRGLNEDGVMIGISGDSKPSKEEVEMLKAAAPWAKWVKQAHGASLQFYGVPVGYGAWVWSTHNVPDPAEKRYYGWKKEAIMTVFPRTGAHPNTLFPTTTFAECWMSQEGYLMAGFRGVARIGADFWPVFGDSVKFGGHSLAARYAQCGQVGLGTSSLALLEPGPDGALTTLRLETLFEGDQMAQARIFIEKALMDDAMKTKLGEDRVRTYQEFLDARARVFNAYRDSRNWYPSSGWQDRLERLYTMAGEVAGTTQSGVEVLR